MNREYFENKKVLVVGLGKSGIAAMEALVKLGAQVNIQDSKTEDKIAENLLTYIEENKIGKYLGMIPEDMGAFDILVLSPGVPTDLPFINDAREKGVKIMGELELAYRVCPGTFVAITGTNGKTTTTTLAGEIFAAAYEHTYVVGNIGVAVVSKSLEAEDDSWLVTECSSFQLETIDEFKPVVSAILNLTPDHLNRHKTMENYGGAKARVFENQDEDGYLVINYDDKLCYSLSEGCKAQIVPFSRKEKLDYGAYLDGDMIVINDGNIVPICRRDELKIIGKHNVENVLAAAALCYFAGISAEIIGDTIKAFGGVEHRIEYVDEIAGVKYYNDSKGTNTDATITAIRALEKNIILLAGGDAKKQDFAPLAAELEGAVKTLVLYGRDAGDIKKACDDIGFTAYVEASDLEEAVKAAVSEAEAGDSVLLSPACASWDAYPNFEARGDHFKKLVGDIK